MCLFLPPPCRAAATAAAAGTAEVGAADVPFMMLLLLLSFSPIAPGAVSDKKCVPQRADEGLYPIPADCALDSKFNLGMLTGRFFITAGLNPLFDIFDCQVRRQGEMGRGGGAALCGGLVCSAVMHCGRVPFAWQGEGQYMTAWQGERQYITTGLCARWLGGCCYF